MAKTAFGSREITKISKQGFVMNKVYNLSITNNTAYQVVVETKRDGVFTLQANETKTFTAHPRFTANIDWQFIFRSANDLDSVSIQYSRIILK